MTIPANLLNSGNGFISFQSKSISRYTYFIGTQVFRRGSEKRDCATARMLFACLFFIAEHFSALLGLKKCYAIFFLLKGKHGRGGYGLRSARPYRPQGGDRARYPALFVKTNSVCPA